MNRQMKNLMAQAQKMQADLARLQEELAAARIEGGSGAVKAVVNGQGELIDLHISPTPWLIPTPLCSKTSSWLP